MEVLGIKKQLSGHLNHLKVTKLKNVPLTPQATDEMAFQLGREVAQKLAIIPEFGRIVGGPFCCSNATIVEGDGLKKAIAGQPATFAIKKNPFYVDDEEEDDGGILKVKSKDSDSISAIDITEEGQGVYKVTYVPNTPGTVCLAVFLKDDHIHGSPFVVSVHKEITYTETECKKYVVGLTSDGPGQFVCPYGVAISPLTGDIWVTDSGNDRDQVQVFGKNKEFRFQFGKVGNRKGEFKDPADISFVGEDRVAVVDRGNHRVQIFTAEGSFVMAV